MTSAPSKWFDSLPAPINTPKQITPSDLHELLHGQTGAKVVVVDVRRADIEGDQAVMLPSAVNLPAQTFHQTLPTLVPILNQYTHAVFHCSSSNGRGPRCASWYEDACNERGTKSNAYVLTGGIKAWMEKYPDEVVRI